MTLAKDISRWQGTYSETGEPIVFAKITGGDQGLYLDPQAANNYNQIIAHGHAFGGYHFAGGGDPIAESNYFLAMMKPWNPGEVAALDWEVQHPDPVGWCLAFVNNVHAQTGAWPLLYINLATLLAYNWWPVLTNCGLWLADWTGSPDGNINSGPYTYVMQQYSDGPNYDHDVFFGTVDQFKKYGWPAPAPTTTTTTTTTTATTTTTTESTTTTTTTTTTTNTTTTTLPPIHKLTWWQRLLRWLHIS